MKPQNKLQRRVAELSYYLPAITKEQESYAYDKCFEHKGFRTKTQTVCMDCGHIFQTTENKCVCPGCNTIIEITDDRHKSDTQLRYFAIIDICEEFQIIRFFYASKYIKVGEKLRVNSFIHEVCQHFILPDGTDTIMGLNVMGLSGYNDQWIFSSELSIKYENSRFDIYPSAIYPKMRVIPIIKRNGFKNSFHNIRPLSLFQNLIKDSKTETLFKAKQFEMLKYHLGRSYNTHNLWPSIKICIRNKYIIKNADIWSDHIDTLKWHRKDILNPKYICLEYKNLIPEHNRLVKKRKEIQEKRLIEEQKKEITEAEINYKKTKGMFFGLMLSDGNIEIVVLDSINEFIKEGETHHHCVFTSKYYNREDSLILSARKGDERLETIEFNLKELKVVQSRGLLNKDSEYHDKIIKLVNKNKHLIKKRNIAC